MEALAVTPRPVISPHHRQISPHSLPAVHFSNRNLRLPHSLSSSRRLSRSLTCSASSPASLVDNDSKFNEAAKNGNLIPLYRCIFSDHLTPVLAYRCLVKEDDREAPSFLFESVEPGFKTSSVGRYSVVGAQPSMEIVAKENLVTVMDHYEGKRTEDFVEDPMSVPKKIMEQWNPQLIDELPDVFCGEMNLDDFVP